MPVVEHAVRIQSKATGTNDIEPALNANKLLPIPTQCYLALSDIEGIFNQT